MVLSGADLLPLELALENKENILRKKSTVSISYWIFFYIFYLDKNIWEKMAILYARQIPDVFFFYCRHTENLICRLKYEYIVRISSVMLQVLALFGKLQLNLHYTGEFSRS